MSDTAIVDISSLHKAFGETVAVEDVSFQVFPGEIVGLLGPNGAGKTTTLSMLLGLIKPTSGKITIFGKDFEKHRIEILKKCNFSSAYVALPGNLKVIENLRIFAKLYNVK